MSKRNWFRRSRKTNFLRSARHNQIFAGFERLEDRRLLAVVMWDGGGDNVNWTDPQNWSADLLPTNADDVLIDVAGAPEVTLASGTHSINSLLSNEILKLNGGTLTVGSTIKVSNTFTLAGTTLVGATIQPGDAGQGLAVTQSSILDAVTLSANLTVQSPLTILNGLALDGVLTVSNSLYFTGTQTLLGSGQVKIGEGSYGYVYARGTSSSNLATLTIGPGITVHTGNSYGSVSPYYLGDQIINLGHIRADVLSRSLTISAPLINQGTLEAANGSTLAVSKLAGAIGEASVTTGGALILNGVYYNAGMLAVTDGSLTLNGDWDNNGMLEATNSTVNLGGTFTLADLGTLNRSGGTVNVSGTLDNTGTTLALNARTGSWALDGGTILGGTVTGADGAELVVSQPSTLDGVSLSANLTVQSPLTILNGLALDGVLTVNNSLYFTGTQTLLGSGQVKIGEGSYGYVYARGTSSSNLATLTIGPGITVHTGNSYGSVSPYYSGDQIINQGLIRADVSSRSLTISAPLTNQGTLEATNGSTLYLATDVVNSSVARIVSSPSSGITVRKSLTGDTLNASQYLPKGALQVEGSGTAANPQFVEVMGRDLGAVAAGLDSNFVYGTLSLLNTYVKLIDSSDNVPGTDPEAIYVNSLVVPSNSTFDLNGLNLYTRAALISGTIIGGSVTYIPDGGTLRFAAPTPGKVSVAAEVDEWTFFGLGGRHVGVVLNPGGSDSPAPLSPYLNWADVRILAPDDTIVAQGSSAIAGGLVSLIDVPLPENGLYRVQIRAAVEQPSSTGNYLVSLWDVTADEAPLNLNQRTSGTIANPFNVDRYTFSAAVNQQVQLDQINSSVSGLVFDLSGPGGVAVFTGLSGDSELITLTQTGSYVLTARTTSGDSGNYAFQLNETSVLDLAIGSSYAGTLAGTGFGQLFRIEVSDPSVLSVLLDESSTVDRNELYARFGAPPTRAVYDYRQAAPTADQELMIPRATPGIWYVLVYGASVPNGTAYTLQAIGSEIDVVSVAPDRYATGATATLTVHGGGFVPGTTVELVASDSTAYPASSVQLDSATQLTGSINLSGVPQGSYAVRVTRPGGASDTLAESFTVLPVGGPQLETRLITPDSIGRHVVSTIYVEYANTGNEAMPAPLLVLQSADPDNSDRPLLTLDESRVFAGFWSSAVPSGFRSSAHILASGATPGVLQPGETARIPVYSVGLQQPWDLSDDTVELEIRIFDADNATPIDWNLFAADERPASIGVEAWDVVVENITTQVGSTWGDYTRMLDENAAYLGRLGQSVLNVSRLWDFEIRQANGINPLGNLTYSIDASDEAPGISVAMDRAFGQPISSRFELGPFGRGWSTGWDTQLQQESDGSVMLTGHGGVQRQFQPDSRTVGGFFSAPGDYSSLVDLGVGVFELREPSGLVTRFLPDGKIDYVQDTNGNRITATYTSGLLTSLTHSAGPSLTLTYNGAGRITAITDSLGRQTVYTYDAANEHLLSVQDPEGRVSSYTYATAAAANHALTSIEFPDGTHQYFTYDSAGRLLTTSLDQGAEQVTYGYDTVGGVTITDAGGATSTLFLDSRGSLAKVIDPLGRITALRRDALGRVVGADSPSGDVRTYSYDGHGNVTHVTDELGQVVSFDYGIFERMTAAFDAQGNAVAYSYDAQGNLILTTYANNTLERTTRDAAGNVTSYTNRRGETSFFVYDAAGRMTQQTNPDGSHTDYAYDSRGNLISATDAGGAITLEYDLQGNVTKVTYPTGRYVDYSYDTGGRRTQMVTHDGFEVNYLYDAAGRLAGLRDGTDGVIVDYSYDASGRLAREDKGNGTYTTYEYDAAGQLIHLINFAPGGAINSRFDYTYDSLGRRIGMGTLDGQWTYAYDATGQLTRAVLSSTNPDIPSQDLSYVYDAAGNRVRTIENGVTTEYDTNNLNQYTTAGAVSYHYDADGNLISRNEAGQETTYTYDALNQLVGVVSISGTWSYEYDAFGNRVAAVQDGERTEYLLDPSGLVDVVAEYDAAGNRLVTYVHGQGLESLESTAGRSYYDFDAVGSTVGLSGATGSYDNSYHALPFGEVLSKTESVANPFEYVGQWGVMEEGNGLHYMRARYYASSEAVFQSVDPLRIPPTELYLYAGNDPLRFTDPQGLDPEEEDNGSFWDAVKNFCSSVVCAFDPSLFCTAATTEPQLNRERKDGIESLFRQRRTGTSNRSEARQLQQLSDECGGPGGGGRNRPRPPSRPPDPGGGGGGATGASDSVRPSDPNEKSGPAGVGNAHFVPGSDLLPYRIDFENDATATAPAQHVLVTDQLSPDLEWDTFSFTEFGFGDTLVVIPPGTQHYQSAVEITYNGLDFEVQTELAFDAGTGRISASFWSINPLTSLPPDVLTGFLPPEDGTGRGMGHFSYIVRPDAGLPTGTEIRNIAFITFDSLEIIATNQIDPHDPSQGTDPDLEALITIDAGAPTSAVLALPDTLPPGAFIVNWEGDDDAGGSGIRYYEIYVSTDGSPFELLAGDVDVTVNDMEFVGEAGHIYAFYTVAVDNVGHRELAPVDPDAQVTVLAGPTAEVVGLHIFYENSAWDDPDGPGNPFTGEGANEFDDLAIADKQALLPGGEALFINYTSYNRGINGIMIDVDGLIAEPTLETVGSFFAFRVGNDDTYTSPGWTAAPAPMDVTFRPGVGDLASDRITLIWADNVIEKQWLEVTMLANGSTGLTTPHVHFWGNAIGETGNDPANATVNATDQTGARDNFTTFFNPADIMNPYDFNRDKRVNATDQTIARDNFTSFFTVLKLIEPPAPGARGMGEGASSPTGDRPDRLDDSASIDQLASPGFVDERSGGRPLQTATNLPSYWTNVYYPDAAWPMYPARLTSEVVEVAGEQLQQAVDLQLDFVSGLSDRESQRFEIRKRDGQKVRLGQTLEVELEALDDAFVDGDFRDWDL